MVQGSRLVPILEELEDFEDDAFLCLFVAEDPSAATLEALRRVCAEEWPRWRAAELALGPVVPSPRGPIFDVEGVRDDLGQVRELLPVLEAKANAAGAAGWLAYVDWAASWVGWSGVAPGLGLGGALSGWPHDREVAVAAPEPILQIALDWCTGPGGSHRMNFGVVSYNVVPDQRLELLRQGAALGLPITLSWEISGTQERRVSLRPQGQVVFSTCGQDAAGSWATGFDQLQEVMRELAPFVDWAALKRTDLAWTYWQTFIDNNWPPHEGLSVAMVNFLPDVFAHKVPDTYPAQLLTGGHPISPDTTRWRVERLGEARWVVARDLDAWLQGDLPGQQALAEARAEWRPILMTDSDRRR